MASTLRHIVPPDAGYRTAALFLFALMMLFVHPLELSAAAVQSAEGLTAQFVNRGLTRSTALYFACLGLYLGLALVFLIYWRWMRRDKQMLSMGLLALVMAAHTAAVSGSLPYIVPSLLDTAGGMTVETVCYMLLNAFIAFMLWTYFPNSFRPRSTSWMGAVNTVVAGLSIVASVVFAVMVVVPGGDDVVVLSLSRWITVLLMIVATALALQAIESDRGYGVVTGVGIGFLVVTSIHDILFAGIGAAGRPYLITFGVLGFILLQAYVILHRSAEATHLARLSSRRLRREVDTRTKELRAATVAAQAANMAKTDFVTAVTHELRTPLSSLLGYVDLIRSEVRNDLEPDQIEFFDNLELSADRLLTLVNNLLDLAKIESGRIEIEPDEVDLTHIVEYVRSELYPIAREKNIALATEMATHSTSIRTDQQWLGVVLANLVSNAVKYTDAGGVTIRLEEATLRNEPGVAVKVIDTGPGISSTFMPRLFKRFARDEHGKEHSPNGSGLGLTIARELVNHLGGEITVSSTEGEGSTFTVVLPVSGPTDAA
ncbi:MAG: HAMP domain-containing sensor histidine kinase [Rhodothermales bacterium]